MNCCPLYDYMVKCQDHALHVFIKLCLCDMFLFMLNCL